MKIINHIKNSIIVILLLFPVSGCNKSEHHQRKETEQYKEFKIIMDRNCFDSTSTTEKIAFLTKCSSNNVYCKSLLGNIYYKQKQYDKAFDLLVESQGNLKGSSGFEWAPSELALGEMYALERGVSENKEEAKIHLTKCALAGDSQCANWMLSFAENDLKAALQDSKNSSPAMVDYAARNVLYWGVIRGSKLFYTSGEYKKLNELIINKKVADEWLKGAEKIRNLMVMENFTINTTYPNCRDIR